MIPDFDLSARMIGSDAADCGNILCQHQKQLTELQAPESAGRISAVDDLERKIALNLYRRDECRIDKIAAIAKSITWASIEHHAAGCRTQMRCTRSGITHGLDPITRLLENLGQIIERIW